MNIVEINGVKSTRIRGLMISELPPIVRPEMRAQIEEIDGVAGQIVTELGYQAYERVVKIGLHGSFDIDDVIRYFSGAGNVIFSNEPDKVYDFWMLKSVSYERLVRFRTAEVTFLVQPYKHSALEGVIELAGSPAGLRNHGNVEAMPTYMVAGSGNVTLSVNGGPAVTLALGSGSTITIDCDRLEAYSGSTLKNRSVTGDYLDLALSPGANTLEWTGSVSSIKVGRRSRWI